MNSFKRNKARTEIARKIRALREERHWTQAELSKGLGLSQSRLSEIERGQGSFTADQFLEALKLFSVPVSHFAVEQNGSSHVAGSTFLARLRAPLRKVSTEKAPASEHQPSLPVVPEKSPTRNEGHRLLNQIDMDWD